MRRKGLRGDYDWKGRGGLLRGGLQREGKRVRELGRVNKDLEERNMDEGP